MAIRVVTVNDILDGNVGLDLKCLDRDLPKRVGANLQGAVAPGARVGPRVLMR